MSAPAKTVVRGSKRFRAASEKAAGAKPLDEAVAIVKAAATAKFDETVEAAIRLGIDTTKPEENVRGTVVLPNGTGKNRRVLVFALGEPAKEAETAGAETVGGADLVARILKDQWMDFDVAIATPDMMREVGKLGKILGPRGLMPNPKSGTVTFDIGKAVKEFRGGKVEFRNDKGGNLHVIVGKASFEAAKIAENVRTLISTILRAKPASSKGAFLRTVTLSSTMGPGVRVDPASIRGLEEESA